MTTERFSEVSATNIHIGTEGGQMFANVTVRYSHSDGSTPISVDLGVDVGPDTTIARMQELALSKAQSILKEAAALPAPSLSERLAKGMRSYEDRASEILS